MSALKCENIFHAMGMSNLVNFLVNFTDSQLVFTIIFIKDFLCFNMIINFFVRQFQFEHLHLQSALVILNKEHPSGPSLILATYI